MSGGHFLPGNPDGAVAHVDQVLVTEMMPGGIVIMDDLSSHKGVSIRTAIEAAGARMHRPIHDHSQAGIQNSSTILPKCRPASWWRKASARSPRAKERSITGRMSLASIARIISS